MQSQQTPVCNRTEPVRLPCIGCAEIRYIVTVYRVGVLGLLACNIHVHNKIGYRVFTVMYNIMSGSLNIQVTQRI